MTGLHQHAHSHRHAHAAPRHAVAGAVTWSLLRLSAGMRVLIALAVIAPIWAAIVWVIA